MGGARSQRHTAARAALYAGASALAIAVAVPQAHAADLIPVKAPPVVDNGEFRAFVEGGAVWTAGDPIRSFFPTVNPTGGFYGLGALNGTLVGLTQRPRLGWEAATGFDYRFAGSPWHVSAQFRYGEGRSSVQGPSSAFNLTNLYGVGINFSGSASTVANDRETHWLADFAVGRDVNIGANPLQVKAGVRIAELTSRANTLTSSTLTVTGIPQNVFGISSLSYFYNIDNRQNTSFRGAGPRIGFEGAVPLGGGWQVDYQADGALLFGTRRLDNPIIATITSSPLLFGASSFLLPNANQHGAVVPNLDAQLGLSYWLNPGLKLTASYRVDAYFGALSTYDPTALDQTKVDRIFHGPRLTLTGVLTPDPRIAAVAPAGFFKAPPPPPRGEFTAYVEGSAFWTQGDPIYTFYPGVLFNPGYFALKPRIGWDAAAGFDWRAPGSEWHVSAAFNYGQARISDSASSAITATIPFIAPGATFTESQPVNSSHRETHWTADFAVGRDVMLGADTIQVKGGVRVAELTAKTSTQSNSAINITSPVPFTVIGGIPLSSFSYFDNYDSQQESRFRGAGPRIGVEGSVPLRGGFMLDFAADAAVLFGSQSFRVVTTDTFFGVPAGVFPTLTAVNVTDTKENAIVYNADIQAGISYWVTPNLKLSGAYRIDAFFGALRTLDAQGNPTKVDRIFHGPRVAATVKF